MLAALAEVLSSVKIVGSLELVSCLLETLNKVTHTVAPDAADKRYVEQLIMSAVENVVQQFPVGLEVICARVKLIDHVRRRPLSLRVRSVWTPSSKFSAVRAQL